MLHHTRYFWVNKARTNGTEELLASLLCLVVFDRIGWLLARLVRHFVPRVSAELHEVMAEKRYVFKGHYLEKLQHGETHESAVPAALRALHDREVAAAAAGDMEGREVGVRPRHKRDDYSSSSLAQMDSLTARNDSAPVNLV